MAVFESENVRRSIERTFVAIRPTPSTLLLIAGIGVDSNGDGYYEVGKVEGRTSSLDIDAAFVGFPPGALRFDAVQLIDDPADGERKGDTVGADIDAIGAISSTWGLDLVVDRAEFFQPVRAGTIPGIPLIVDKRILVRAFIDYGQAPLPKPVRVYMRHYRTGDVDPYRTYYDLRKRVPPRSQQSPETNYAHSFNFKLQLSQEEVHRLDRFEFEVNPVPIFAANPVRGLRETDYRNNILTVRKEEIAFECRKRPNFVFVPIQFGERLPLTEGTFRRGVRMLAQVFPVPAPDWKRGPTYFFPQYSTSNYEYRKVLVQLFWLMYESYRNKADSSCEEVAAIWRPECKVCTAIYGCRVPPSLRFSSQKSSSRFPEILFTGMGNRDRGFSGTKDGVK